MIFLGQVRIFGVARYDMTPLPTTGSAALLEALSPHIPDDLINPLAAAIWQRPSPTLFSRTIFRVLHFQFHNTLLRDEAEKKLTRN